jgi:DNA-binding LacI/PurR family transcriptional regulator
MGTYVAQRDVGPLPISPDPTHRARTTITLGLISQILVPGNIGLYHTDIIEGMSTEISRHAATLVMLPVNKGESAEHVLEMIGNAHLDAAIYLGPFDRMLLKRLIEIGPPAALVDNVLEGVDVDTVLVDNHGGGFKAMEHLLAIGHQHVAVITGADEQWISRERVRGACAALEKTGFPPSSLSMLQGTFQRDSGYNALVQLIKSGGQMPTGIFCLNDEMAFGAMQAVRDHTKLRIPEDFSVIGFDNTKWATESNPPLTTVQVPTHFMGRLAIQRIVDQINDKDATSLVTTVPTTLMVRKSTARPAPQA